MQGFQILDQKGLKISIRLTYMVLENMTKMPMRTYTLAKVGICRHIYICKYFFLASQKKQPFASVIDNVIN